MRGLPSLIERAVEAARENRKAAIFFAACALFMLFSAVLLGGAEAKLSRKRLSFASFEAMRAEYAKGVRETGAFRERLLAGSSASALDQVQSAAAEAGLRKNIGQLKPFEPASAKGFRQSGAEVTIEGALIAQAVTFLYNLENGGGALLIDEFQMKSSFEDPDRLEVRARVRLLSRE